MGRLDAIKARVNAATEGPWAWGTDTLRGKHRNAVFYPWCTKQMKTARDLVNRDEDAEFIAEAREDVPWLAAELERTQAALDALLDDATTLMDQHASEEVKKEARLRIIERHGSPSAAVSGEGR